MNNTSAEYSNWEYRNIALSAAAQCAILVHELASTGVADSRQLRACVDPLLILNPGSSAVVYPDVAALSKGMTALQQAMGGEGVKQFPEAVRYLLSMTVLQQKLLASASLQKAVRSGIEAVNSHEDLPAQDTDAPFPHYFPWAEVARLYQSTISTLSYRIHVAGNPEHLREQHVADKIRTLLLAGIRSAVLWHQLGGRRWHLVLHRKRIRDSVAQIRRSLLAVNSVH